jgi:hypothetical protein
MLMTWTYIDNVFKIYRDVKSVHCDTRDFAVAYSDRLPQKDDNANLYRLLHGSKINERFLIHKDRIIPWLKEVETIAGGKAEWRCLNFNGIDTRLGWLKYIRMYRYNQDMFVVCDSYGDPICWDLCTEENLDKESLGAH